MSAPGNNLCQCGQPAKILQTKKETQNKGRWFFSCATGSCKHFAWNDAIPRDGQPPPAPAPPAAAGNASGETNHPLYEQPNNRGGGRGGYQSGGPGRGGSWQGSGSGSGGGSRSWGPGPGKTSAGMQSPPKAFNPSAQPVEVIFTIFDGDRIGVRIPMNETINRWLRERVQNVRFDGETKLWIIDQAKYEEIADAMEDNLSERVNVRVTRIPDFVWTIYQQHRAKMVVNPEEREKRMEEMAKRLPPELMQSLLPFQKAGVRKGIENDGRVFICDEMGLGKTIQALSIMAYYRQDWPALIVCPSSLRMTWKGEIKRWLGIKDVDIQVISASKDYIDEQKKITIVSYDLAAKGEVIRDLTRIGFDCIVADESHNLKSTGAKRTQSITPLLQGSRRTILLSGTPALSRPIELFPQLACLKPKLFPSLDAFGQRYCDPRPSRFNKGIEYKGATNLQELHWILDKTILVRRLKKDVLKELPEKRRQCILVEVPPANREVLSKMMADVTRLEEMKRGMITKGGNDGKVKGIEMQCRALYTDLYTQTGSAKLPAVTEYVEEIYNSDDNVKIIVFGHHKEVLDGLAAFASNKLHADYIRIDGATAQRERQMLCDQFQNNPGTRIAILSIKAAGVGLTLNKADFVIFAELYWNPGDLLQGEDRAHRIGRIGPVAVKYIIAGNSLDDRQWPLVRRKLEVVGRSVDGNSKDINIEETDGNQQRQQRQSTNRAAKDQATITNFFRRDEGENGEGSGDGNGVEEIEDDDLERVMMDFAAEDAAAAPREEDDIDDRGDDDGERSGNGSRGPKSNRKHGRPASSDDEAASKSRPLKRGHLGGAASNQDFGRQFPHGGSAPPDLPIRRTFDGARPLLLGRPPKDPTMSDSDDDVEEPGGFARPVGGGGVRGTSSGNKYGGMVASKPISTYAPAPVYPPAPLLAAPVPVVQKAATSAGPSTTTATDDNAGGDRDSFFDDDDDLFMEEAVAMATQVEFGM